MWLSRLMLTNGVLINGLNHLLGGHDKTVIREVHKLLLHIEVSAKKKAQHTFGWCWKGCQSFSGTGETCPSKSYAAPKPYAGTMPNAARSIALLPGRQALSLMTASKLSLKQSEQPDYDA